MSRYIDYADQTDVFVKRTGPGRKGIVFPVKLFLLLKYIDLKEPNLKAIISWNHHGRSFKIHDHMRFRQIILPRFYATTSNETFRRQLSFWGFKRISAKEKGAENGSYYHEKFLRSKDYLCRQILRTSDRLPDNDEPDFERMQALPSSDQHRLTIPESDDKLFEMLLSTRRGTINATTSPSAAAAASVTATTTEAAANTTTSMLNPSNLTSNIVSFDTSHFNRGASLLLRRTGHTNLPWSSLLLHTLHPTTNLMSSAAGAAEDNDTSNDATASMRPSHHDCSISRHFNNNFNPLLTSSSTNHVSKFNSTSTENINTNTTTSIKPNHDVAVHPFNNSCNQETPLVIRSTPSTTNISTQQQILSTANISTTEATEENRVVADNDRIQAYQNIDLEQLLSDENEWQWRHLQPFPICFQPPLSEGESEDMDQFMSFVRGASESKSSKHS